MLKGVLEGIILEIISKDEVYGYEIMRRLNKMGLEGIVEGTLYTILMRLERNRMVNVTKKPSELGPPRKFYSLNQKGEEELLLFWDKWNFINECILKLKDEGENKND